MLSWRLSNTMDVSFCVSALEEALARLGKPEIFNTDQGSQFTSAVFTGTLAASSIRIPMDGGPLGQQRLHRAGVEQLASPIYARPRLALCTTEVSRFSANGEPHA